MNTSTSTSGTSTSATGTGLTSAQHQEMAQQVARDAARRGNDMRAVGIVRTDGTVEIRRSYVAGKVTSDATHAATYSADGTRYSAEEISDAAGLFTSSRAAYVLARQEGTRATFRRDAGLISRAVARFAWDANAEFAGLPGIDMRDLVADATAEAWRLLLKRRAEGHQEGTRVSLGRTVHQYRAARHAVSAILRSNRAGLTGLRNADVAAERSARARWESARDGFGALVPAVLADATDTAPARTVNYAVAVDTSRYVNVRNSKGNGHGNGAADGRRVLETLVSGQSDLFTRELYRTDRRGALVYPHAVAVADHGSVAAACRAAGRTSGAARESFTRAARAEIGAVCEWADVTRDALRQHADAL